MKLAKASIWFVVILFPLFWINHLHVQGQLLKEQVERTYNRAVDTAVDDAVMALNQASWRLSAQETGGYESPKHIPLSLNETVHTFWESLSIQLQTYDDDLTLSYLMSFIPMMVVIGYDGYYVYSWDEYRDEAGELRLRHIWSPKQPYTYTDPKGVVYSFTLDDYVSIYDSTSQFWVEGYQRELQASNLELLQDAERYEAVRMRSIIDAIQTSAAAEINRYNEKYARWGKTVQFTFPSIPDEEWQNTLQDVGMLVWMQGHQGGIDNELRFAYGSARMMIREPYYAAEINGIKRVFPASCKPIHVDEVFHSEIDAALAGYYPTDC